MNKDFHSFVQTLLNEIQTRVNQFLLADKRGVLNVNHIQRQGVWSMANSIVIRTLGSPSASVSKQLPVVWVFAGVNYPPSIFMPSHRLVIFLRANKQARTCARTNLHHFRYLLRLHRLAFG